MVSSWTGSHRGHKAPFAGGDFQTEVAKGKDLPSTEFNSLFVFIPNALAPGIPLNKAIMIFRCDVELNSFVSVRFPYIYLCLL